MKTKISILAVLPILLGNLPIVANAMETVYIAPGQTAYVGGVQVVGQPAPVGAVQVICSAPQPQAFTGSSTYVRDYNCLANSGNSDFRNAVNVAKQNAFKQCALYAGPGGEARCADGGHTVKEGPRDSMANRTCTITYTYSLL